MSALPHVYRNGSTASQCLAACVANIDAREPEVRAWATLDLAGARATAARLDQEAGMGHFRGPLHGVPLGVKDMLDVAGFQTRAGSRARAGIARATTDAMVVAALRAAGCVILGKTHTTEHAYLDPTVTVNPFNPLHTPGGSSSGSGAAIGAGMAALALGTQTVGSVCRPAAYCGAAAFKPTTGSTKSLGVVEFSATYDTIGFFAPRLEFALEAWRAACATGAAAAGVASASIALTAAKLAGLRFAIPSDAYFADVDSDIALALRVTADLLERAGAKPVARTLGVDLASMRAWQRTVMFRDAALAHRELFADRGVFERLGPHWRDGIAYGNSVTLAAYDEAKQALHGISTKALKASRGVDFLLVPATKSTAPTKDSTGDPGLILPWTIFGSPLAVLPLGLSTKKLPVAVMLAGRPDHDARLGSIALALEALINAQGGGTPAPRIV